MQSFRLVENASTHWAGILVVWAAFIGLCTTVGIRISIERPANVASLQHWTRSIPLTFALGAIAGLLIGAMHLFIRNRGKNRCVRPPGD